MSSVTVNSTANNVGQINKINAKTIAYKNEPFKKYDELKKFVLMHNLFLLYDLYLCLVKAELSFVCL